MFLDKLLVKSPGMSAISYRVGGMSALGMAIAYVVAGVLYVIGGAWPSDGEGWLAYLAAHSLLWWTVLALLVTADLLSLLVAWAIYLALRKVSAAATIAACSLLLFLVALDLTITWPACFSLLTLSSKYMASVSEAERQLFVAAAVDAFETLSSPWILGCEILCPAIASMIVGLVIMKVTFRKIVAHLGVVTGVVGIVSVVGPLFMEELGITVFIACVLITTWFFLIGVELLSLEKTGMMQENQDLFF